MWIADEFKSFFSKYGKVVEHEIIRDHTTKRSRGFGFIVFDSEKVVDNILADGSMIDMAGTQVSVFGSLGYFHLFGNGCASCEEEVGGLFQRKRFCSERVLLVDNLCVNACFCY